jgi:hypothetical protein
VEEALYVPGVNVNLPAENGMFDGSRQGVLGETYNTLRAGTAVKSAPKYPLFDDSKYELSSYFSAPLTQTVASLAKMLAVEKPATSVSR